MAKLNYLNVGCGNKFHKDWINIDMNSNSPYVISHNLLEGLPFENDKFDVIYQSQVLEHFPKEKATDFIKECYRVLKPNGIIRIVVPDLENIVDEYKLYLNKNPTNPDKISEANYDWILLEMYDQTVRNYSGGQMAEFIKHPEVANINYIIDRMGFEGKSIRENYLKQKEKINLKDKKIIYLLKKIKRNLNVKGIHKILLNLFLTEKEKQYLSIGKFRLGGEIHFWMYDRFSLRRLLGNCKFRDIEIMTPYKSNIPKWEIYELDVKNNDVYDPTSLFIEAKK
ncbi:MAG: methyltransferase domain-containing protein [Bacteroidales bacterium]|nr:methyltransferase domain-containing protein [Bacteroidales bacterium]